MTFLASITSAEYRGGFRVHLTFNVNSEGTVDFRQWLDGPVFEPLKRDLGLFRRVKVEHGTICWENGADMDPDVLYRGLKPAWMEANTAA